MGSSAALLRSALQRLSSPTLTLTFVWVVVLVGVSVGPIAYPGQPSWTLVGVVAAGLLLFALGDVAGRLFSHSCPPRYTSDAVSVSSLKIGVVVAAILGLSGIALILFERSFLSGIDNSNYAGLLRCAPDLVGHISVVRTPLIYVGYLTFSFGFASIALFLLRGEELRGWSAWLAQLSALSPVGYALTYSGRMSILIVIVLVLSIGLVRLRQGRTFFPHGHHLLLKLAVGMIVFVGYTNSTWASRREFCERLTPLISELRAEINGAAAARKSEWHSKLNELKSRQRELEIAYADASRNLQELRQLAKFNEVTGSSGFIERTGDLTEKIEALEEEAVRLEYALQAAAGRVREFEEGGAGDLRNRSASIDPMAVGARMSEMLTTKDVSEKMRKLSPMEAQILVMEEAWKVRPSDLLLWAVNSGYLSPSSAFSLVHNAFYFTQSAMIVDRIWRSRRELSSHLGVYQIGVLSPLVRNFFPDSTRLDSMKTQLFVADIYGFFPGVWGAAIVDFGVVGGAIYIALWGAMAGWSLGASVRSNWTTPALLLTFSLTSIALSPIQGPLGLANSALLLFSLLVLGLGIDLAAQRQKSNQPRGAQVAM